MTNDGYMAGELTANEDIKVSRVLRKRPPSYKDISAVQDSKKRTKRNVKLIVKTE